MMEEPERYRRFILSYLQEYRQQRFLRMYPSRMVFVPWICLWAFIYGRLLFNSLL